MRAVGLIGDGEMGVRGRGDRRAGLVVAVAGRARESLGLAARASILTMIVRVRRLDDLTCLFGSAEDDVLGKTATPIDKEQEQEVTWR